MDKVSDLGRQIVVKSKKIPLPAKAKISKPLEKCQGFPEKVRKQEEDALQVIGLVASGVGEWGEGLGDHFCRKSLIWSRGYTFPYHVCEQEQSGGRKKDKNVGMSIYFSVVHVRKCLCTRVLFAFGQNKPFMALS